MIPERLKMVNFMPYRGELTPFSFTGIHTACVCGDNGSGKSALIDAITWALWGKSRAKSDDELVTLGENEAEITFDFRLDGQLYRILRKHSMPRRQGTSGQSSLDLFLLGEDGPRVITGDTISQTQQKIIGILRMDYDTFINSAFIRQGHAGEFTQQRPARRKEVLATILGLELYDRLEQEARERTRQQEMMGERLESVLAEIDSELCQQPSIEAALKEARLKMAGMEEESAVRQARLNDLRREMQAFHTKKNELQRLDEQMPKAAQDLKRWQERLGQSQSVIKESTALIDQCQAIEDGYRRLVAARRQCDELNQKMARLIKLKESSRQLEKAISKAQGDLLARHAVSQSRIDQLTASWQELAPLTDQRNELNDGWRKLAELETPLEEKRKAARSLEVKTARLEADINGIKQALAVIDEKLNLLTEQEESRCPLCETELGGEGLDLVAAKYALEKEQLMGTIGCTRDKLADLKDEQQSTASQLGGLEAKVSQDKAELQRRDSVLERAIAEAETAGRKLAEEKEGLAAIETRLAGKEFAAAEQEALAAVEKKIDELGYDAEQHRGETLKLAELEPWDGRKMRLEEAERRLAQDKENAASAEEAIAELKERQKSDEEKQHKLSEQLVAMEQVELDLGKAETGYRKAAEEQQQAQQNIGSLTERLKRCRELKTRKTENRKQLKQAGELEGVYRELTRAFGKKGIQAMLIETALPEIEAEANRLLGRMTDNRMTVRIDTQRQSKKGETLETLDIKISDELGTRSYEMYSGGEAFRIDFAIRIALSQLLARRAGAPLPTLIIDEGFGTQDSNGIERLKEAINSIQDDFEKILVITHIDELKDAFPTQIEVSKTARGATISVN